MDTLRLQIYNYIKNTIAIFFNSLLFLFLVTFFLNGTLYAQQSLELGGDSATNASDDPDSDNTGPTTEVTFPFVHNIDNPSDNVFTTYLPTLNATITITRQQYSTTQDTDADDSDGGGGTDDAEFTLNGFTAGDNPASTIGWNNNSINGGTSTTRFGAAANDVNLFNTITQSNPTNSNYASLAALGDGTTGSGISVSDNNAVYLASNFEALRGQTNGLDGGSPARYLMATMTISFNQPVNDPILHFLGLGGIWSVDIPDDPVAGEITRYINSATMELEFVAGSSSSVNAFSKLSGTNNFEVDDTNKLIRNNADVPDVNDLSTLPADFGVGSGSALIDGDDITTLVFNLYARGMNIAETRYTDVVNLDGDATEDDDIVVANEGWNWAGGGTANNGTSFPEINFSSDSWMLSLSTAVESDDTQFTGDDCFRMLSSPVDGTTYASLLEPIWTQGVNSTSADYTGGDPHIWLWPLDNPDDTQGNLQGFWNPITGTQFDNPIPAGSGFLVSVFTDDNYNEVGGATWPKDISLTGSENAPITATTANGRMNTTADGWSLLGNPFKSTIDWDLLFGETGTTNVVDAVYVYDRNNGSGAYRSYVGGAGDLTGGLIAPFQGFFVQNSGTGATVDFTDAVKTLTDGTFYGKEKELHNFARFEVNGEDLYNSMWIRFSNDGSANRTWGDALELQPLATEYAMLGTRKADGTIFDIGHYPIPDEEFEIPVSLETTRSGIFTITATDFDLSIGSDLYFIDLQEQESIRIDENFSYEFSTQGIAAKTPGGAPADRCSIGAPQKAKTIASSDRFMIATQPKDFVEIPTALTLNQNYPNPFNPTTQIKYELPQQSDVRLEVYDLVGRQVATLVNQTMEAGAHTVNFNASNLSSGVYIYRLNAGSKVLSRKLTVIK